MVCLAFSCAWKKRGPKTQRIAGLGCPHSGPLRLRVQPLGNGSGILFREYCFGRESSLSSATKSVSSARNSVSSLRHRNTRLKGTHWVRFPELNEPRKLTEHSPKPCSARLRTAVEEAVENRGWESRPLWRFCFALVLKGFRHYNATIARLIPLSALEQGGWELLPGRGSEMGRGRAAQSHSLSREGPL